SLPDDHLETFGIVETRYLYDDAVVALPLDRRLRCPELVHTAADDLDGTLDDVAREALQFVIGIGHRHGSVVGDDDVHADAEFLQLGASGIDSGKVPQLQPDLVAGDPEIAVPDIGLPERRADAVDHAVQPILDHRIEVGLHQQIGTALQI